MPRGLPGPRVAYVDSSCLPTGRLCSRAPQKSTSVHREAWIHQLRVAPAEPLQRVGRQPPVRVRAAEAPRPRARIAAGERALERLVQRGARSELAEDDLA